MGTTPRGSAHGDANRISTGLRASLLAYAFGLALLTAYVGFAAGLSESPVVATLVPLIFGLLGGAGGFYIAQEDLFRGRAAQKVIHSPLGK
jgi:hypothetical protein